MNFQTRALMAHRTSTLTTVIPYFCFVFLLFIVWGNNITALIIYHFVYFTPSAPSIVQSEGAALMYTPKMTQFYKTLCYIKSKGNFIKGRVAKNRQKGWSTLFSDSTLYVHYQSNISLYV